MLGNIKALIIVLAIAWPIWALAKRVSLRFTAPEDFARRRNVWFAVTTIAFVSPSLWVYLLFAGPVIAWAARRDTTPLAVFLLLFFVVPPFEIDIPTVLINQLFTLTNPRVLELLILLPAVCVRLTQADPRPLLRFKGFDALLIAYGLLQLVLFVPYEAPTNTMRRSLLFFLDTYLVFFAFSRLLDTRRAMADAMAGLCLSAALAAPIAVFESLRGWLLYIGVHDAWTNPLTFAYLFRGESLRAQAAAGHAITLGYLLAMAMGFWMYLKQSEPSRRVNVGFFTLMTLGLYFTYSRGPWVMAALVVLVAILLGTRNAIDAMKVAIVPTLVGVAVIASPLGAQIIDLLPYVGSAAQDTVDQRQQLAETSWRLIQQNPWFGNPFVLVQMEELRSGAGGIIDLVNGYVQVALFYGLFGLALFLAVYFLALYRSYFALRRSSVAGDRDMVWLGASLIACMVASLFLMATSGQLWLQWVSAAMLGAYAKLQIINAAEPARATSNSRLVRPRGAAAI